MGGISALQTSKKHNICMLGHKRIPSREGGIEIVVEELSTRMIKLGHKVTCYNRAGHHVSGKKYNDKKRYEYKGIKLKVVPTVDIMGLSAISSSFCGAIMAALGSFDIIHFHAEGPCAMIWIPKLFGKRCIATIHGLDHQRAKWGKWARSYIMLGEKCAAKYADEIIVLSKSTQKYFKDIYNRETSLIPNGVNYPEYRKAVLITEKYELKKDEYILFLGRIVPEKGIQYLIEAFMQVSTNKRLVIAGGASDTKSFYEEIKSMAQKDRRILFTGFVQGQVLEELYSNAYLYIHPSDLEGMPLSLLEAMSYGNCCMVSDIEECKSVVENKAITFKKSNIADLKEKLQRICDDEKIVAKYRENVAEFVCKKYNWDCITIQTLELYKKEK